MKNLTEYQIGTNRIVGLRNTSRTDEYVNEYARRIKEMRENRKNGERR